MTRAVLFGLAGVVSVTLVVAGLAGHRAGWSSWVVFLCLAVGFLSLAATLGLGLLSAVARADPQGQPKPIGYDDHSGRRVWDPTEVQARRPGAKRED